MFHYCSSHKSHFDDKLSSKIYIFLADRTNGRANGTVLRPSVVCRRRLYRIVLWLNGVS